MNSQGFSRIVKQAYLPFMLSLGFAQNELSISGRAYHATFAGAKHVVIVSFEPGDDALIVIVRTREAGELSDIDDRLKSPRLTDLSALYMPTVTSDERVANDLAFEGVETADKAEQSLVRSAKELRLVLPKLLHS